MASFNFILPGRRKDHVPLSKANLAKAFAVSRASNPRNVEYPWYGYWCQILVDLTSAHERLLNIPQHLLYYTLPAETEADSITVDDPGDTSISSIPSVAATTPQPFAYEIIPDFAIIRIIFRWREPDGPRRWRNVKIRHAGVPLLVEIKRAGGRSARSLVETLVHMAIAQNEAMLQAAYLFRMIPVQQSVMLMACTGHWWSCRIVTRDQVQHLEVKDEEEADFIVDEDEHDGDSDDEMDDGMGNELTDNDLNQLEDETESAVSAQNSGRNPIEHLEPIVEEAKLELPTSRWTNAMRLESRASNQKLFLIHQRLEQVLNDDTRTMG
jgi:hypothetical protein